MTELVETLINSRWSLLLPKHRAERPQWSRWYDDHHSVWRGGWEVERLNAMREVIKPGDVVYDIGAEEGDLSALYAMWAKQMEFKSRDSDEEYWAGGGVVLFEPNPRVWPNIKAIFEANDLKPLCTYVGFASQETTTHFDTQPRRSNGFSGWPECAYGEVIGDHGFMNLSERNDIPRTSIDYFVQARAKAPDAITIDSEGSEYRVLKGAENTLVNHRPEVFVSIHPEFMSRMYQDSPDELMKYMDDLGYDAKFLAEDHELHYHFSPF